MRGRTANRPPEPERHRIEIGGAGIAYRVLGDGPPVVLVHGLAGSGRWWERNVGPLAERFRVFVVDLPGFGGNRVGAPFALVETPALLAAWLDRLGLGRVALVGHSMGGRVAAELAAEAPERVARLVLVDAAIFPAGPDWPVRPWRLAGALRRVPPGFVPILAADAARAGPWTLLRAGHALLTTGVEAKLPRIVAPTLVVWGDRDSIVPPSVGERLTALVPGGRLVVLAGGDHSPMWSRADAFNAAILEFLTEAEPADEGWA
ncbi:MAG: hypothetical protein AVDCRST_MAG59-3698 [uncultured Thermomicrobiales bacterium]|uniref:AB hydrolase-1 domain-containing protein n=1 Tax=uncultured Thermomicrobiales bacterium TaxID=1645740 RepID=A0A6J4VCU5_9BACT|nr:MAG: hypothetical protein AVDCRST_MAG59-3698 [uncultured Thermomicrobiales bacterium]